MGKAKGSPKTGGRKVGTPNKLTPEEKKVNRMAEEKSRAYIEKHIKPVLKTYGKLAKGYHVHKTMTTKGGDVIEWDDFVYDAAILKHYMDRVLPARLPENKTGDTTYQLIIKQAED